MRAFLFRRVSVAVLAVFALLSQLAMAQRRPAYLGLDRNDYPGDAAMQSLRQTFAFTGYWLNNPPGADHNSWKGKRLAVQKMGYGFLILFNGREYAELKASGNAAAVGSRDAAVAAQTANREGFPRNAILFLDQEQGGRMLPEQQAYLHAWIDGVIKAGFRAGIYCSGIPFRESSKVSVVTATDIRDHAGTREIHFFISNDECGPSPGCVLPSVPPSPTESGIDFAEVWQYAQSPRRPEQTAGCRETYALDGKCYPPGVPHASGLHIDIDTADSADPSNGRTSE
ncbi:MAG TPA: glycoside hydrolase domain-containing protein [Candidatus Eisenbacteria bacterium]|nr:glycoside hydrolase domain-containing protein [Candidatus Eisenbacteria bacterium]